VSRHTVKAWLLFSRRALWPGVASRPLAARSDSNIEELWVDPHDLPARDRYRGPWGAACAPDPNAEYRFVAPKKDGVNRGMIVRDPLGREWKAKQPPSTGRNAEASKSTMAKRPPAQ
jgi:hypothetical protein